MLKHAGVSLLLGASAAVASQQLSAQQLPAQQLPTQQLPAELLPAQQSREDAWWTGPMIAANGATLPQGHALIEPYLFNIITSGHFDENGNKHSGPLEHDLGSLTYMLYGVTDNITAGLIPRFFFDEPAGAPNSSGVKLGDLTRQSGTASRTTVTADPHRTSRSWCRKRCPPAVTIVSRGGAMELAPEPIRPWPASTCSTISGCRTDASCAAGSISPTASPPPSACRM
jgi:hypothetical protein